MRNSLSGERNTIQIIRRIRDHFPAAPSTNFRYKKLYPSPYDLLPPCPVILDIGAKSARARYFGPLPSNAKAICIDIAPGPGVDIVADAQHMPEIPSESADCIFVVSVLQHVPAPQRLIEEAYRILKPGGVIYVSAPFIFVYHRDPEDFQRFSVRGLEVLCSRFERLATGSSRGPASTFCDILIRFLAILFSFNSSKVYSANVYAGKWALFWIKYFDIVIARYSVAYIMGGAPYFLGRKSVGSGPGSNHGTPVEPLV